MFGLSTREILMRGIENACRNELGVYRDAVRRDFDKLSEWSEEEIEQHAVLARKEYANAVFDAMQASFRVSNPTIDARMRLTLWNPGITGIPEEFNADYFVDNGFSAGITYAICYFAITNKKINPSKDFKIISRLDHYQSKLMNDVLCEFDK